jgi:hypothetical protein
LDYPSNTKTPITPTPKKAFKKGLKKSSLKGSKASKKKVNKAAQEGSGGSAEDAEAMDE